jgi:hypothetical protein
MSKFQVTVEQVALGLPDFPAELCRTIAGYIVLRAALLERKERNDFRNVRTWVEGDYGHCMRCFLRVGTQPGRLVYSEDLTGYGNGAEFLGWDNFSYSCPSLSDDVPVLEVSEVGVYCTFYNDDVDIPGTKQMIVTLKNGLTLECQAEDKSLLSSWILVKRGSELEFLSEGHPDLDLLLSYLEPSETIASEQVARWFVDLGEV